MKTTTDATTPTPSILTPIQACQAIEDPTSQRDYGRQAAVKAAYESVAAWCCRKADEAARESQAKQTAADGLERDEDAREALLSRADYCDGEASALRAVAAKLRELTDEARTR